MTFTTNKRHNGVTGDKELYDMTMQVNRDHHKTMSEGFFTESLHKVMRQTQDNDHNGATTTMARYVRKRVYGSSEHLDLLVKACEALETLHAFYGHMPQHLSKIRDDLRAKCFANMPESNKASFECHL